MPRYEFDNVLWHPGGPKMYASGFLDASRESNGTFYYGYNFTIKSAYIVEGSSSYKSAQYNGKYFNVTVMSSYHTDGVDTRTFTGTIGGGNYKTETGPQTGYCGSTAGQLIYLRIQCMDSGSGCDHNYGPTDLVPYNGIWIDATSAYASNLSANVSSVTTDGSIVLTWSPRQRKFSRYYRLSIYKYRSKWK